MNIQQHLRSRIVDTITGEILCGCGCGLVISEKLFEERLPGMESEPETIHYKSENNMHHDKGLGSVISHKYSQKIKPTKKQQQNDERLRKLQSLTRAVTGSERRLVEYLKKLQLIENDLGLTWALKNDIITYLRKLDRLRLITNKHHILVLITLSHIVKKIRNIQYNPKEYKKYNFSTGTYLKYLSSFKKCLGLDGQELTTSRMTFMINIAKKLNVCPKSINEASKIVDYCVEKCLFISRHPSVLAATCLYVVELNENTKLTISDFSDAAGCSSTSIISLKREMNTVFELFNFKIYFVQTLKTYREHEARFN